MYRRKVLRLNEYEVRDVERDDGQAREIVQRTGGLAMWCCS